MGDCNRKNVEEHLKAKIDKLERDNEVLKKACEFYGVDSSYRSKYGGHIQNKNFHSAIGRDCGLRARQALSKMRSEG